MSDASTETAPAIDLRKFRDVLGHYPTGVVVVTGTAPDGSPVGMVVGTFSSVSLEPPLVSFMPTAGSATYAALRESPSYCVNVLAHDQRSETRILSQRDPEKFDKVSWTMSPYGVPQLDGAVAYIHCTASQEVEAGDHLIVLCDVQDVEVARPVTPLLCFQGGYGGFSPTGVAAYVDAALVAAVRVADVTHPQLKSLAERFDCEAVALVQVNDHDQTIGAAARSASVATPSRLGTRIPLIPPLGEAAVAWNEDDTRKWLGRIHPQDPAVVEEYRSRLDAVHSQGYALQVLPTDDDGARERLSEALHEYSLGELTPASDRAVRAAIAASSDLFPSVSGLAGGAERVDSISVPVFDPTSASPAGSGLVLRVRALPEAVSTDQVGEIVSALHEAADEVTAALAGPHRRDYERYVESGLRERA